MKKSTNWGGAVERRQRRRPTARARKDASATVATPRAASRAPQTGDAGVLGHDPGGFLIVAARRVAANGNDVLLVVCPFCGREHVHGACGQGSPFGAGDGYRRSHCRDLASRGTYRVREAR